jgi:hypothetical protein
MVVGGKRGRANEKEKKRKEKKQAKKARIDQRQYLPGGTKRIQWQCQLDHDCT